MGTSDEERRVAGEACGLDTAQPLWETRVGYVVDTDGEGRPVVDFSGNPAGPQVAQRTVPLAGEALAVAVAARQSVQLRFEDGNPRRPVIVGLLEGTRVSADGVGSAKTRRVPRGAGPGFEVRESEDGVEWRCGRASIRLMPDGRLLLKGTRIDIEAEGVNRIRGGVVDIG